MMESVPGAVATGSKPRDGRDRQTVTRSLPLPVLTSSRTKTLSKLQKPLTFRRQRKYTSPAESS
jgi:hypothetical protein